VKESKFLTRSEIGTILARQKKLAACKANKSAKTNLAIFRLSCCCGLRVGEISGLEIDDLILDGSRPTIRVRPETTKGKDGKRIGREVPLHWDRGTLEDLQAFMAWRIKLPGQHLIVSTRLGSKGEPLSKDAIASRWATMMGQLGKGRASQLSIHSGRHSFISHSLAVGRSLAEVQRAVGHRSVGSTSVYLHYLERDGIPDVFAGSDSVSLNGTMNRS
jgi:integrase